MARIFGRIFLTLFFLFFLAAAGPGARAGSEIKVALVTPEGSTWTRTLHRMADEVRKRTGDRVRFRIYAGGVSGDELDVLRKMQAGRINAAGFSGVGLGVILPEIRILEAPLLYRDYAEVDHVKETLYTDFSDRLEKKGFVLLGFAEAGFVYFFSKVDLSAEAGLRKAKMWAWKGDPVAETFFEAAGIRTYPLHVTDVNTGLERGMIDSFYSPPLAAVAFQWYARVRYMLDHPMVNSTGALLVRKRDFMRLSEGDRAILRETAGAYCRELVRLTRKENQEAREVLAEAGIEFVSPSAALIAALTEGARKAYDGNMAQVYTRPLFDRVETILDRYRNR